jgi:Mg2+-importing ATPase
LENTEPQSDFEQDQGQFGKFLLRVVLGMTVFVSAANALAGKKLLDSFLFAVALAVGITPEVLPVIMTITLSKGA